MDAKTITLPKTKSIVFEYTLISLAFLIPFFISGPQLLTGTIVNTLLYLFAFRAFSKKLLVISALPSIGALLNSILFGTVTGYLLYFLPFIWVGNYLLVHSSRYLLKKYSLFVSLIGSALIKSLVLFSIAYFFTFLKIVPQIFLQAMGIFQLGTAIMGGVIAGTINTLLSKKND